MSSAGPLSTISLEAFFFQYIIGIVSLLEHVGHFFQNVKLIGECLCSVYAALQLTALKICLCLGTVNL